MQLLHSITQRWYVRVDSECGAVITSDAETAIVGGRDHN
jgi:hypothetical protein